MNDHEDADQIDLAYGIQLRQEFQTLFYNTIAGDATATKKFGEGLKILRAVRQQALTLIQEKNG
jgi:hypothetical protein